MRRTDSFEKTLMPGNIEVGRKRRQQGCIVSTYMLSHVRLFTTPWTVAHQDPLSMGFPRQEYWSGLPFPCPGNLPNPETQPVSPGLAGRFFTIEPPGKP